MVPVNEKRKPHYELNRLKRLIRAEKIIITRSSEKSAFSIGFSRQEILDTVLALRPRDFYKSMTTYRDHKIWQDVYKPRFMKEDTALELYIKLQESIDEKCVIISFKSSEEDNYV